MASTVKPQVLIFQETQALPSELQDVLRAHISGGNAQLHRYTVADEKSSALLGSYDRLNDQTYSWPNRSAGSVVDQAYTKLYADDALLMYLEDLINDNVPGHGTVSPVPGYTNRVRSDTINFAANGTGYPRSGILYDRDVKVGDVVHLKCVTDPAGQCNEVELWTSVKALISDAVPGTVDGCRTDANNQGDTQASTTITQIGGPTNCISATADGANYNGLPDGYPSETYTIEVIQSSIQGCTAARLRVTSASGTDDQDEVEPAPFGSPTPIGTRGLTVTFTDNTAGGQCETDAANAGVAAHELVVGQKWQVVVSQDFEAPSCSAGTTFNGDFDDVYIIEVTKGGKWADLPEITVTTAKGLDRSGPTVVTGGYVDIPVGSYGLTMQFVDPYGTDSAAAAAAGAVFGGNGTVDHGLNKGDKFYITVTGTKGGNIRTLELQHDLPDEMRTQSDLELRLFIKRDGLEIPRERWSSPPNVNWEQEATQITVKAGIEVYDDEWTDNGTKLPLPLYSATLYAHYREWLSDLTDAVYAINSTGDLEQIPGPLDVDNPLKWGVYKALTNTNGEYVKYTAVADPDDPDSWQRVLDILDGDDTVYNLVPLTYDDTVIGLYQAFVNNQSGEFTNNWKGMFVGIVVPDKKAIVDSTTSTDGNPVLAVLEDDPDASGTQYTIIRVPAGNVQFITAGVKPGDTVRYLFSTDAFGNDTYQEFTVDAVLSETSLRLLSGYPAPVSEPQRVEVWRTMVGADLKEEIKKTAQSYADTRVCAVWPDVVKGDGVEQPNYYLCAALAGLVSSVPPHQSLTNVEVKGFDDYSRSYPLFSRSELDELRQSGVWIVTTDRDGTPFTFHAVTTNVSDLATMEEMDRRNKDSISYYFLRRFSPFIGKANATPTMVDKLQYEFEEGIDYLSSNTYTPELGPQVIGGTLRDGYPRISPILADRIELVADIERPFPLNNIEFHMVF